MLRFALYVITTSFLLISMHSKGQSKITADVCDCRDTFKIKASYDYTDLNNSENFQKMINHPKRIKIKQKKQICFITDAIDTVHSISIFYEKEQNPSDSTWKYNDVAGPTSTLVTSSEIELKPHINVCNLTKGTYSLYLNIGIYSERMVLKVN